MRLESDRAPLARRRRHVAWRVDRRCLRFARRTRSGRPSVRQYLTGFTAIVGDHAIETVRQCGRYARFVI